MIEMLLESLELSLDDDAEHQHLRVPGFLFDMDHFFEALVTRVSATTSPRHRAQPGRFTALFESSDARRGIPIPRPNATTSE